MEFIGERIYEIIELIKLYVKFEEKNFVILLIILNLIEEMIKGDIYDLVVDIVLIDVYNKFLLFILFDVKVMSVFFEGILIVFNVGIVVIIVINYNGEIMIMMEVIVYFMDDVILEFSLGFNGFINVGEEFIMIVVGVGKENEGKIFIYVLEEDGIVEFIGINIFKVLLLGIILIDIFDGVEFIYIYIVVV